MGRSSVLGLQVYKTKAIIENEIKFCTIPGIGKTYLPTSLEVKACNFLLAKHKGESIVKKAIITISVALGMLIALAYSSLQIMNSRTFMFFGELVNRVEANEKIVALTFDDGPSQRTGDILDVLDQLGIKATFFVNGSNLAENPELGQRIVQAGHELGNH